MRRFLSLAFVASNLLVFGLMIGCSVSDSTTNPPGDVGDVGDAGEGRMQINLIDAPGDYDEVNIEIVEVRVHRSGADSLSGWHTISVDTTCVNLLDLTDGHGIVLADSTLPAGHYQQVRLILGENNTVVVDGVSHELEIPSSSHSGLKLVHGFWIEDGVTYSVTLDFDADRSIHRTGNGRYKMRPVIRLIVDALSGSLSGVVEPVDARAVILATVGTDTAVAYADTLTGHFVFPMLSAGIYDLEFSATAGSYAGTTVTGVEVTAGQETILDTVVLTAE